MWMRSPGPWVASELAMFASAGAVGGAGAELAAGADALEGCAGGSAGGAGGSAGGAGSAAAGLAACANAGRIGDAATKPARSEARQDRRNRTSQSYHGAPRSGGRERRGKAGAMAK